MRTEHYLFLVLRITPKSRAKVCVQWKIESNSLDTPRHQNLLMCPLNNKVMWRPMQPMLNNYMWTSGPEPRVVRQPGSDTNISSVSHNFQ